MLKSNLPICLFIHSIAGRSVKSLFLLYKNSWHQRCLHAMWSVHMPELQQTLQLLQHHCLFIMLSYRVSAYSDKLLISFGCIELINSGGVYSCNMTKPRCKVNKGGMRWGCGKFCIKNFKIWYPEIKFIFVSWQKGIFYILRFITWIQ